jgi:hypothetical protein
MVVANSLAAAYWAKSCNAMKIAKHLTSTYNSDRGWSLNVPDAIAFGAAESTSSSIAL